MNYLFVVPSDNMHGLMTIPPGIVYVATALKESGRNVIGRHLNFEHDPDKALLEAMREHAIDVICTGGLSDQFLEIRKIISLARQVNDKVIAIVGGGLISSEPEIALAGVGGDIGIIGQGEISICEVAEALENDADLTKIAGLVLNDQGETSLTPIRYDVKNLDAFSFPDYDIFPYEQIPNQPIYLSGKRRKNLNVTASRSCPYSCTFCYHPSGSRYSQRSLDNIFSEIDQMLNRYDVDHISVIDELFATDQGRVFEFCERIEKYDLTYAVQLRVDSVSLGILQALKKSGCIAISYGVESADNKILSSMRKKISIDQIENALSMTKDVGIFIQGNFIFGDIEETVESVNKTLRWWMNHLDYGLNLYMIRVFPGSYLYEYALDRGIIQDRLDYLEKGCPPINVSKLTNEQVRALSEKISYLSTEFIGATYGVHVTSIEKDGTYNQRAECMNCGTINFFEKTPFEYRNVTGADSFSCKCCAQKMRMSPANAISKGTYKTILDKVLQQYFAEFEEQGKKIAIWGVTEKTIALLMSSKSLRESVVVVVDRDFDIKNWKLLERYNIQSPAILPNISFDFIIIGASGYEGQIRSQLSEMGVSAEVLNI